MIFMFLLMENVRMCLCPNKLNFSSKNRANSYLNYRHIVEVDNPMILTFLQDKKIVCA